MHVVAGRDFSAAMKTDASHAFIINETAVKQLGFGTPDQAIGKNLAWHPWNASNPDSLKTGKIIGVVKDFNYKSLYNKVETTVLQIYPEAAWQVAVKINAGDMSETINSVKKTWDDFSPNYPIEYKFLDDNFTQLYNAEDKLKSLLFTFTVIAVFVSCLGLFGLSAYAAKRRQKEVAIRKILGANTKGLVLLLSKDFTSLVVASLLIASPVAWYFTNKWLENFAYRINISWWIFVITAIISLSIAFVTLSFQSIKAAMSNPVKYLRIE